YAIHLLARTERLRRSALGDEAALASAMAITGPAILIDSGSSILGFAVLLLSQVPANHRLGGLLSLSLGVCVLATLWVVPVLAVSGRIGLTRRVRNNFNPSAKVADDF